VCPFHFSAVHRLFRIFKIFFNHPEKERADSAWVKIWWFPYHSAPVYKRPVISLSILESYMQRYGSVVIQTTKDSNEANEANKCYFFIQLSFGRSSNTYECYIFNIICCIKKTLTQTGRAVSDTLASKRERIILLNLNISKVNLNSAIFSRGFSSIHMEYKYNSATNGIKKQ